MKRVLAAAGCVTAVISFALSATPALAQANIEISYEAPKSEKLRPIVRRLQERKALETLREFLSPLTFPMKAQTAECGGYYPASKPGGPLTICYEYVDLIESALPEESGPKIPDSRYAELFKYLGRIGPMLITREMATVGPFVHYVLHETALTVFNSLELPIWGRRHDAADYAAAFLLLQFGSDVSRKTVYGTAYFLNQLDTVFREEHMADVNYVGGIRPTIRQRYYNLLCIAVGRDPIGFSPFIAFGGRPETRLDLPASRLVQCRPARLDQAVPYSSDYEKVRRAFNKLVTPKLDQEKLKKVRDTKWIPD